MRTQIQPTVPVAEFGITGLTAEDVEAWARINGVSVVTDYLGRPAVTLADAYKVGERREMAEAAAARVAVVRSEAANAQRERERIFNDTMADYLANRRMTAQDVGKARKHAWAAVREAEKDLPREVRELLTGVPTGFVQTIRN